MSATVRESDDMRHRRVLAQQQAVRNNSPQKAASSARKTHHAVNGSIPAAMASAHAATRPTNPLDSLLLPVRLVEWDRYESSRPSSRGTPRGVSRPSSAGSRATNAMATTMTLRSPHLAPLQKPASLRHGWHKQIWGVSPGYRQNESLLEAVRAAERRPMNGVASYSPRGICLDACGKQFVVRNTPSETVTRACWRPPTAPALPLASRTPMPSAPGPAGASPRKWYERVR